MMDQDDANSDFIAHARQDTPSLLSIVRELQARVAELETILALSGEATIPYQTTSATHVAALEAARKEET